MSTTKIYGTWDSPPQVDLPDHEQQLIGLWHNLAIQNEGTAEFVANNRMTQRKNEFIEMAQLFRRVNPRIIAEIGIAQGGTLAAWAKLARKDAHFIAIDRDPNDALPRHGEAVSPHIYNGPIKGMTEQGGGLYHLFLPTQRVDVIRGWTTDPEAKTAFLKALGDDKIDWMTHDASHEASMFHQDFEWMWPLISEGGVLMSHDIQPSKVPSLNKGIEWERIKREEEYSAVYEYRGNRDSDSMGIGILIK